MKLDYYDAMGEYGGLSLAPPEITLSVPDTIAVPANITLNATVVTTPPNQNCTFKWEVGSTQVDARVNNPGSKMAGFNSAGLLAEVVTLSLKATDENGLSTTASKQVEIQRLAITSLVVPLSLTGGEGFTPEITVNSPNGPVTYLWDLPAGLSISNATDESPQITTGLVSLDTDVTISCTVTDSEGVTDTDTASLSLLKVFFVTLEMIDTLHFELVTDKVVMAIPGTSNREVFKYQLAEEERETAPPQLIDENGFLYLDLPGIDKLVVRNGNQEISSEDGPAGPLRISNRTEAHCRVGDVVAADDGLKLPGSSNNLNLASIIYVDNDTRGLVLTATTSVPAAKAQSFQIGGSIKGAFAPSVIAL